MRISDWSSDVCSSDLRKLHRRRAAERAQAVLAGRTDRHRRLPGQGGRADLAHDNPDDPGRQPAAAAQRAGVQVGAAELFADPKATLRLQDRKSVGEGTRWSVRVDLGGRRIFKKKK